MLRRIFCLPLLALTISLLGCSVFSKSDSDYTGSVTVGLTDAIPDTGSYTPRVIFAPDISAVLAVVQIDNAKAGMKVDGKWYQLATLQQKAPNQTPDGILVSEAGFTVDASAIDASSGRGGGTLRLVPNAPLPEDSYLLRVYVDGKLAKTEGFVVNRNASTLQPAPAPAASPTPAPTATRTP